MRRGLEALMKLGWRWMIRRDKMRLMILLLLELRWDVWVGTTLLIERWWGTRRRSVLALSLRLRLRLCSLLLARLLRSSARSLTRCSSRSLRLRP